MIVKKEKQQCFSDTQVKRLMPDEEKTMIKLFTDTSANLPSEILKKYNIGVVPFTYQVDGVTAQQDPDADFDGKKFYDAMRAGASVKTSMINIFDYMDAFRRSLENGDDVLYIGMSGGISGAAHSASIAVMELQDEYPDRRIAAIDTFAASLGEGLLVIKAAHMIENNVSFERVEEYISEARNTMCQFFTVDDLEYLKRGGRLSGIATLVGSLLKIKPILKGDEEGKIISCGKARGKQAALLALAEKYDSLAKDRSSDIGIAHADDINDAEFLLGELRRKGFTGKCLTVCYEPVTGAHVGPGTVALFFPGIHK